MYLIGIDISKYKHDCFIITETGLVIRNTFSFDNSKEGFAILLDVLTHLDRSQEIKIGLEATGHYGLNLKSFLNQHGFSFTEFNPLLIKRLTTATSLRRTKTDKVDAMTIANALVFVPYKTYRFQSYHISSLKSLTRFREALIKQRSLHLVQITNILDRIFPEFKQFFNDRLQGTPIYILQKYKSISRIAHLSNKDIESIHNYSRRISTARIVQLRELAKSNIGVQNQSLEQQLQSILNIYEIVDTEVTNLEAQIIVIMDQYDCPTASIKGISSISAATIISEFEDISKFSSPDQMLSYAGMEPGISQSGTQSFKGKMVKHGSSHLRYALMNVALTVIKYNPAFYSYYLKKRSEGKQHRVALSHVVMKLLRIIFILETTNCKFNPELVR